jgi:hypothetical protein
MFTYAKTLGRYSFLIAAVSSFGTIAEANVPEMKLHHEMAAEAPMVVSMPEAPVNIPMAEAPVNIPMAEAPVNIPMAEAPVNVPVAVAPVNVPVAVAPVNVPVAVAPVNVPVAVAPVNVPVAVAPVNVPVAAVSPVAVPTQTPVVSMPSVVPTPVVVATPMLTSHTFAMPHFSLANSLLNSYSNPQLVGVNNANHHYWTGNTPRAAGGGMAELQQHMMPATSLTVPTGFAGGKGTCFWGGAISTNRPPVSTDGKTDGAAAVGCGFGDPNKLGGSIMYIAETIGLGGRKFNASGSFAASIGHNFDNRHWGLSLRVTNIMGHSDEYQRNKDLHWALALSKLFSLGKPGAQHDVVVNVGAGNGYLAYEPEKSVAEMSDSVRPYLGLSYGLTRHVSAIVEDANGMTAAGFSFVPSDKLPCTMNVFGADLRGKIPDHKHGSLVVSGGCAISV